MSTTIYIISSEPIRTQVSFWFPYRHAISRFFSEAGETLKHNNSGDWHTFPCRGTPENSVPNDKAIQRMKHFVSTHALVLRFSTAPYLSHLEVIRYQTHTRDSVVDFFTKFANVTITKRQFDVKARITTRVSVLWVGFSEAKLHMRFMEKSSTMHSLVLPLNPTNPTFPCPELPQFQKLTCQWA